MSQITQQKATDTQVRRRMEKLLRWDAGRLNECEYEQGIQWLDTVFGQVDGPQGLNVVRRKLEGTVGFWAWWKNQWANLDAQLSPNLKVALIGDEWKLGYYAPNIGATYYTPDTWNAYYQRRHAEYMAALRPDDDTLRHILKAA
ncbi:hypothetical protein QMK33_00405 [Hymenobacter sp. H14-R3]|uniref:hypothetical protein n=1 Tax=Hymenobacter sp. H14-R3 TaxID=3046308 RepID=UPI0024BB26F5|nr:hypothetical protein [Hymenobacter sp. H14-R3]MDJ0363595.1 hypothetical protein [Hymenobacter sp. H14-R3]